MKITQLKIDWMQGYANRPRVFVYVDEMPKFDANEPIWNRTKHNYIWAEQNGIISYIVYTPRSNDKSKFLGFAGREFKKTLKDGTVLESNNWWSGGAYGLVLDDIHCVDIVLQPENDSLGYSGYAITLERLQDLLKASNDEVHVVSESIGGHIHYVASCDPCVPKKPDNVKSTIVTVDQKSPFADPFKHYFAVCGLGWATAKTAVEAHDKLYAAFKDSFFQDTQFSIYVYSVPLPEEATYDIRFFRPVVDGCEVVMHSEVDGTRERSG